MPHPLFIYGTLHPDRAPAAIAPTVAHLRPLGPATVRGRLLDLGTYPGLIISSGENPGDEIVHGHLFAVPDDPDLSNKIWSALDRYEDYRPASPESGLYTRVLTEVTLPDASQQSAWVYLYNR
jgi:gamma-glutamylcyclotransferase (GGCT)/AIG2-like uncharacterized protein YtfP